MLLAFLSAILFPPLLYMICKYFNHLVELKKYPPGPIPLPVIGNMHQLGKRPYKTLMKMREKYGDVFSVSFGGERMVIINSIEAAREALITRLNDFSGRPYNYQVKLITRGFISLPNADFSPYYTSIKKLAHSAVKMFGEGNLRIQQIITEESEYLHKRLKENSGSSTDIHSEFGLSVINLMSHLMFGERYKKDDEEYKLVIRFNTLMFRWASPSSLVEIFPFLRYLPNESLKNINLGITLRDEFLRKKHLEHKSTYNSNKLRDCVDAFIKVLEDEKELQNCNFTDDNIEMLTAGIIHAGTETTITILRWAILYLLYWPQYQDEIYKEIKETIGANRYPDLNDRRNLGLTNAFIQEVLRYCCITPLGLPRKTTEDTEVGGYSVPKGTRVMINMWSIHQDPKHWENPEVFDPRRFLNEDGEYNIGGKPNFIPFSAGRRSCFGETIAKQELFLLFSRLMRDFKFNSPSHEELPDLHGISGFVLSPVSFNVVCTLRDDHLINS